MLRCQYAARGDEASEQIGQIAMFLLQVVGNKLKSIDLFTSAIVQ